MYGEYYLFGNVPPEVAHHEILPKLDSASKVLLRVALYRRDMKKLTVDEEAEVLKEAPIKCLMKLYKSHTFEYWAFDKVIREMPPWKGCWIRGCEFNDRAYNDRGFLLSRIYDKIIEDGEEENHPEKGRNTLSCYIGCRDEYVPFHRDANGNYYSEKYDCPQRPPPSFR